MAKKKKKPVIQAAGGIIWKKEGGEKKLAVVHRHKHNDWSLPKGKVDSGESWKKTAIREVLEETGCVGKIKKYAGSISYLLDGKPKVVLFWHMDVKDIKPSILVPTWSNRSSRLAPISALSRFTRGE